MLVFDSWKIAYKSLPQINENKLLYPLHCLLIHQMDKYKNAIVQYLLHFLVTLDCFILLMYVFYLKLFLLIWLVYF